MKNNLGETFFQSVWSSLTGGWFYNPHVSIFINTVHMYIWLILFGLPLIFYLLFDATLLTWSIYVTLIGLAFSIFKVINFLLNKLFDSNQIKKEEIEIKDDYNVNRQQDIELNTFKKRSDKLKNENIRNINRTPLVDVFGTGLSILNDIDYTIIPAQTQQQQQQQAHSNSPTTRSLFKISEESLNQQHQKSTLTESTLTATDERVPATTNYRIRSNRRVKLSNRRRHIMRSANQLVTNENTLSTTHEPEYTQVQSDTRLFVKQHHHSDSEEDENEVDELERELVKVRRTTSDYSSNKEGNFNTEKRSKSYNYLFENKIDSNQDQLNNELKEAFVFLFSDDTNQVQVIENEEAIVSVNQVNKGEPSSKSNAKIVYYLMIKNIRISILFDHYTLISMFDRNDSWYECLVHVLLALATACMTSVYMISDYFGNEPHYFLLFIFSQATCLYSLVKSCQPDASSSTHGFNRLVNLSRPIYFVLLCILLQIVDSTLNSNQVSIVIYNIQINSHTILIGAKEIFRFMLLALPLLHTIGLFAQINVFIHAFVEQLDIHLFGSNASTTLMNSIFSFIQSMCTIVLLSGILIFIRTNETNFQKATYFSLYCSILTTLSFLLSRKSNDFDLYLRLFCNFYKWCHNQYKSLIRNEVVGDQSRNDQLKFSQDPLNDQQFNSFKIRFESDFIQALFIFAFIFSIHSTTLFVVLNQTTNMLNLILVCLTVSFSWINYYLIPTMRKEKPWFIFDGPLLVNKKWYLHESSNDSLNIKIFWYEKLYLYMNFIIKNIINPLFLLGVFSVDFERLIIKFGPMFVTLFAFKLLRSSYCQPQRQYKVYFMALLLQQSNVSECQMTNLYFLSILLPKISDFLEKIDFIFVYTAPWQLSWGSAFHAFAQPLSIPHSVLLVSQSLVSSLINAPLMPVMGSAFFILSYMRPIKFWSSSSVKNNSTKSDYTLKSQLFEESAQSNLLGDFENFNAVFYEHLCIILQKSLYADLALGRWGLVESDNIFILSSDYLNCLIHIIEIGNGHCVFQLRGLEFKGTYCQQRELEAITEDPAPSNTTSKFLIRVAKFFTLRWYAWCLVSKKYVVNAYRIVENEMSLILNSFSLKRTLIDYYVRSAIYFAICEVQIDTILKTNKQLNDFLVYTKADMDNDRCFNNNLDCDYDNSAKAITFSNFQLTYSKWIAYCASKREIELDPNGLLIKFCYLLSIACKRALMSACNNGKSDYTFSGIDIQSPSSQPHSLPISGSIEVPSLGSTSATTSGVGATPVSTNYFTELETIMHGLYILFKGDIRIYNSKDEWLYMEPDLIPNVMLPSIRMAIRLHQDHFQVDTQDDASLHESMSQYSQKAIITHERDPLWRQGIINNFESLLTIRHVLTEYVDNYKVMMLNKNNLDFRLIKLNKECVKSFWAGQQHELIFLRNKNQERGSIQNAKEVLRNIINSSCDQPIGYPIYVSPLITSYSTNHRHALIGGDVTFYGLYSSIKSWLMRVRNDCLNNCSGSQNQSELNVEEPLQNDNFQLNLIRKTHTIPTSDSLSLNTYKPRPSTADSLKVLKDASSLSSNSKDGSVKCMTIERVEIVDASKLIDTKMLDFLRHDCTNQDNGTWKPYNGLEGIILKRWILNDGKAIVLVNIADRYNIYIDEMATRLIQESTML